MKESRLFWQWVFITLYWLVVMNSYTLMMVSQLQVILEVSNIDVSGNSLLELAISGMQFLEANFFGLCFGTLFFGIGRMLDQPSINRKSFGQVIFIKSALYFLTLISMLAVPILVLYPLGLYPEEMMWVLSSPRLATYIMLPSILMVSFFIILLNFIMQTAKKMGPGYFIPTLLGKYHHPVSEMRIFLFIDLKSSSGIAEKIGHIKYSRLIQDCFRELDAVIFRYNAQIYQYVGDEVVLTWDLTKGLKKNRVIQLYFAFMDRIDKRQDYFLKEYGIVPFFKAGAHLGEVTAAEFGNVKRQIAYHGDVLNTASRIQGECNRLQRAFLLSADLKNALPPDLSLKMEAMGSIHLRGKAQDVEIFAADLVAPGLKVASSNREKPVASASSA